MHHTAPADLTETRQQLFDMRHAAERHLVELTRDLAIATRDQMAEGTLSNHPADASSDMLEAETDLGRISELRSEIGDIDDAIARIRSGSYGICEDCDARIDPARLRVLPIARRCLRCETHRE